MRKNQRGFTLIEMIIVIALIGVLVGSSVAMIGNIRYANAKKVVEEVSAALSELRLETMSQSEPRYLYIYKWSDSYYMKVISKDKPDPSGPDNLDANGQYLCGNSVTINSLANYTFPSTNYIRVAYTKNGLIKLDDPVGGTKGTNIDKIVIEGSGSFTINLNSASGRHYVE